MKGNQPLPRKQVGDSLPLGRFSEQGEVNQFRHVTSGMFAADAEAERYDLFYGYAGDSNLYHATW